MSSNTFCSQVQLRLSIPQHFLCKIFHFAVWMRWVLYLLTTTISRGKVGFIYLLCVMLLNNVRRICIKLQWKYGGEQVYVAGQFNDWQPNTLRMNKNNDDVWELKLRLPAGRYQYKVLSPSLPFSFFLHSLEPTYRQKFQ